MNAIIQYIRFITTNQLDCTRMQAILLRKKYTTRILTHQHSPLWPWRYRLQLENLGHLGQDPKRPQRYVRDQWDDTFLFEHSCRQSLCEIKYLEQKWPRLLPNSTIRKSQVNKCTIVEDRTNNSIIGTANLYLRRVHWPTGILLREYKLLFCLIRFNYLDQLATASGTLKSGAHLLEIPK